MNWKVTQATFCAVAAVLTWIVAIGAEPKWTFSASAWTVAAVMCFLDILERWRKRRRSR